MTIPNIIDPSVLLERRHENVEMERFGERWLFLILKFHITQKLWKDSMEST